MAARADAATAALDVTRFIKARHVEFELLQHEASPGIPGQHGTGPLLRRRASSHRRYALPRRRRLDSDTSAKNRKGDAARPREHRRRSSQLLHSIRAQPREFQWLETHLWHRKRMVMEPRWGFHVALRRADMSPAAVASVRARAPSALFAPSADSRPLPYPHGYAHQLALRRCLLHDASYLACTEVTGPQDAILAALRRLMDPSERALLDPAVLSGLCEATAPVYDLDCFPQCCCGPARLLWRPQQQPGTNRSLWVWAHPGTASTLIPALAGASDAVSLRPATSLARLQLRGPTALACLRRVLAEAVRSGQAAGGAWDALAPIHSAHLLLDGLALPLAVMDPRPAAVRARKALAARAEQRAADTHARHYYAPQSAGAPAPAPAQAAADTLEAAGAAHLAALGDWEHGYDAHAAADGALLGEEDEAALSAADAGGAPSLLRALAAMGAGATPDARAASGAAHDAHAAALDRVRGLADRAAATASSAAEAAAAEDGRCLRRQHDEVRRQEAITRLQAGDATMASHAIVGERAGEGHATAAAAATSAAGTAPGRERSARRGPRQPSAASTQAHALLDALRAPEWDGSSPGPRAGLLLASGSHPLWDASTRAAARDCLPNETALHRVRSLQLAYSAEPGEGERRARESGASQRFAEATARKEKAKAAARVEQARAAAATAAPPPDALLEAEREDWSAVAQCAPLTVVARSLPSAGCRPAGTGVDIVLPAGWVRALWTPLVAAGAAAAGVEDVAALAAEVGCPSFPADWPDTATHATASHAAAVHSVSKLLRTPSKRRAPHWALRAHAPCSPAWHTLFPGAPASEEGKGAPAETTPQGVGAELAGGGEQEQEQGGSDGGEEGGVDEAGAGDQADGEEGVPAVPGPPLPPGWDQRASQVPSWLFDPDAEAAFDELVVIRGVRAAQQLLGPVVAPEGTPAPRRDPRWQADAEEDAPAGAGLSRGLLVDPAVPAYLRSGQVPASMAALAFPALVAVRIVMMGRGRPEPLAYVALPEGDDVAQWVAHGARWCGWEEPVAKGPRKRGRGASSASATRGRNQATSSAVHGFPSQPPPPPGRLVVGRVTSPGCSARAGSFAGAAFCTAHAVAAFGVAALAQQGAGADTGRASSGFLVLVRATSSRRWRPAAAFPYA